MSKKIDFLKKVAELSDLNVKQTENAVKSLIAIIIDEMKKGEKVQLPGFGTFKVAETKERQARNPLTNEQITIKAKRKPKFVPSKSLKEEFSI
ncbi:MAG: HU family DNA-binding protein [Metamycoplasmataceae bacterium]